MTKLKCNLIVKETQSASAKVLVDLTDKKNEDFNVEAIFDEALGNESISDPTVPTGTSEADNPQDSQVKKEQT
jgi:hypothetical protein